MKQLGILDAAFINMEHKNVPQHIGSIGIYDQSTAPDGKVRFKSLIRHFERQIKKIPMFRTRLIQAPGGFARPYWIVDDNFDVEFHLRHIALPYPGDWRQLCIQVARLHSRPLDMSRPLWEAYVIEGLKDIDGIPKDCFAIYVKIHHSLIDGGGGSEFMAAIHDLEPVVHEEDLPDEIFEADARPSRSQLLNASTKSYINNAWNLTKGGYSLTQEAARTALKLVKGEIKAPPLDAPTTRFNQPVSPYRVIESSSLSLKDFKMIKDITGTKLNDVALAVVSGAMRKYLEAHNEMPERSLVASLPIDMRTRVGDTGEGNQIGSIFTSLNSHIDDPIERLKAIHRSTNDAKEFGENTPARDALKLAGAMSPRLTKFLLDAYVDNKLTRHSPLKINTVISNIMGPDFPLYCCGAKLLRYHGLGVLTPGVGIFHLIFTYCGEITLTILADRAIVPDPGFYRECMDAAFEELKLAVKKDQENKLIEAKKLVSASAGKAEVKAEKAEKTTVKKAASSTKKVASSSAKAKEAEVKEEKKLSTAAIVEKAAEEAIEQAEKLLESAQIQQVLETKTDAATEAKPRKRAASSSSKKTASSSAKAGTTSTPTTKKAATSKKTASSSSKATTENKAE